MLAALLLALNDHVFKGGSLLPGWLTGKLSDVAGLFVFPILVVVVTEEGLKALRYTSSRRLAAATAATLTGLAFASIKLIPWVADRASALLGPTVCDPTDLLTLPSVFLAHWYLTRHSPESPSPRWAQALTVLLAGVSSMATSQIRISHGYPAWATTEEAVHLVGCAQVEAWVSRSGKQGAGVTLHATSTDPGCRLHLQEARFRLPTGEIITTAPLPAELHPGQIIELQATDPPAIRGSGRGPGSPGAAPPPGGPTRERGAYLYLPFAFDNEVSWNDGERDATLALRLSSGGEEQAWVIPLHHY
jgi:hypothetical protein